MNDQLNNVALRYERFERMRASGPSAAADSQSDAVPSTASSAAPLESAPPAYPHITPVCYKNATFLIKMDCSDWVLIQTVTLTLLY